MLSSTENSIVNGILKGVKGLRGGSVILREQRMCCCAPYRCSQVKLHKAGN